MLENIKKIALDQNIPILSDEAMLFMLETIKERNIKTILEIGTAVGYSAISFAVNNCFVDTIERNNDLYKIALSNIAAMKLTNKINVTLQDALIFETNKKYDLIFIDGAKAQYKTFFNKYKDNLNDNGIIVCDNLNFHNLDINKVSRSTRQLIGKLNKFKVFLDENKDFTTIFYNIGDGITVSKKNG